MIRDKHGVAITDQRSWTDLGVEEVACEVRWLTEPGWLTLEVEVPTLCLINPLRANTSDQALWPSPYRARGLRFTGQRCDRPACAVSPSTPPTRTT
jgi:hypothetical protein